MLPSPASSVLALRAWGGGGGAFFSFFVCKCTPTPNPSPQPPRDARVAGTRLEEGNTPSLMH